MRVFQIKLDPDVEEMEDYLQTTDYIQEDIFVVKVGVPLVKRLKDYVKKVEENLIFYD